MVLTKWTESIMNVWVEENMYSIVTYRVFRVIKKNCTKKTDRGLNTTSIIISVKELLFIQLLLFTLIIISVKES